MTNVEQIRVLQGLFNDIVDKEKAKLKEIPPEDVNGFIKASIFIKQIIINKEIDLVNSMEKDLGVK